MKISKWKIWLSYLFELHIESAPSEINPHLYVSLKWGRFQLCTANAIYSFEDKYDNFFNSFQQIDLQSLPGKDVLILGFGLGSIPRMLENNFNKDYNYTGVEIDESVIYLASKYGIDSLKSSIQIIESDASDFLAVNTQKFDLIIMDVFIDDKIPRNMQNESYLDLISSHLNTDGLIMYNRLAANKEDIRKSDQYFESVFKKAFPNACFLKVKGNYMLLNKKDYLAG